MTYTTTVKRPCNHALHGLLTLLTCGLWVFVWVPAAIAGRRETIVHHGPPGHLPPAPGWYYDPETGMWTPR